MKVQKMPPVPPSTRPKPKLVSVFCQATTTVLQKPTMAMNLKRRRNVGSRPRAAMSWTSYAVAPSLAGLSNSSSRISVSSWRRLTSVAAASLWRLPSPLLVMVAKLMGEHTGERRERRMQQRGERTEMHPRWYMSQPC